MTRRNMQKKGGFSRYCLPTPMNDWSMHILCIKLKVNLIIRHWTLLVIVKDQSSHSVYINICIKLQTCENLSSIDHRSCEIIMKEKIKRLHILNLRSQNQICGKWLLSRKQHYFRGSCFSQCFVLSTSLHLYSFTK